MDLCHRGRLETSIYTYLLLQFFCAFKLDFETGHDIETGCNQNKEVIVGFDSFQLTPTWIIVSCLHVKVDKSYIGKMGKKLTQSIGE